MVSNIPVRGTKSYNRWNSMKQRCLNTKHPAYKDYGGRGITIDPDWMDFTKFHADMGDPPEGMSLDRKDNSGPYSAANCRWATKMEQSQNQRKKPSPKADNNRARIIELFGLGLSSRQIGVIVGMGSSQICLVLKRLGLR